MKNALGTSTRRVNQKPAGVREKPAYCDPYLTITLREEDELLTVENICRGEKKREEEIKNFASSDLND